MNCIDCPQNCLGQETNINCLYDESTGKSLFTLLSELKPSTTSSSTTKITSDDIISKSPMLNRSHICSSQIIKRDFEYGISINQNTVLFSWDFLPVLTALPDGYKTATIRVKLYGVNSAGSNVFAESKAASAGLSVNASNFPITADITIRLTSPCGNIDLMSKFNIINPADTGTFKTYLDAQDLNPKTGEINLTEQLKSVEAQLSSNTLKLNTYKDLIDELRSEIEALKGSTNVTSH